MDVEACKNMGGIWNPNQKICKIKQLKVTIVKIKSKDKEIRHIDDIDMVYSALLNYKGLLHSEKGGWFDFMVSDGQESIKSSGHLPYYPSRLKRQKRKQHEKR